MALDYDQVAELYRAIRAAKVDGTGVRAVDPERLSAFVSWGRPNPRRVPTVRRTGHEGKRPAPDVPDVMARVRMRRLLGELEQRMPVTAAFVVGAAFGIPQRVTANLVRRHGQPFNQSQARAMVEQGQDWLAERWA